jgi:hypothetical protein
MISFNLVRQGPGGTAARRIATFRRIPTRRHIPASWTSVRGHTGSRSKHRRLLNGSSGCRRGASRRERSRAIDGLWGSLKEASTVE